MANMIEQSLLCKVLDAPDLEILHSNGVVEEMFLTNEGGGVDIAIIRNVIELNYSLGITDADVNLFNTEVGIMQELGGSEDGE